jgi:hypothetical protein
MAVARHQASYRSALLQPTCSPGNRSLFATKLLPILAFKTGRSSNSINSSAETP